MKESKKISMIAYAQYFNDARIKGYANSLLNEGYAVDIFCLFDNYSNSAKNNNLFIKFLGKKYQGASKKLYLFSYLLFLLKAFLFLTIHNFKKRYPVIHVHNQPDFLVFSAIVPKLMGSKIILDLHDIMIAGVISKFNIKKKHLIFKLTKLQTKLSIKFCNALFFADHSQRDFLREEGMEHKNSYVFLNLPDDKYFKKINIPHSNTKKIKFVYHGTLAERLGVDLVIKAVEKISWNMDISFTIIGDGDVKNQLVNYCKAKSIIDRIIFFKSFIPVEQLQNEIENYDVGIIGNRKTIISEKCMLPVKLMEYLYMGIPVIAPRLEVIQRYFSENMIEYYEPENVDDLSGKIVKLAQNPRRREELVKESKHFFEKYNWNDQKEKYLKIIYNLIEH